ncbi:MAG: Histone-like protein prokaryotic DNA-binding protein [Parcubacteria group bacterium GW2011_GWC1_41_7]|nr:MAG: Histone-like protein prokaryotic DNA-binding protein [Parcubacteria group bacterium GW2011_GWC1_41_7]
MAPETVRREQLAQQLADEFGLSKKQAVDMLNRLVELITKSLKRGEQVKLPGLGTFKVRDRKARIATNPRTGAKVDVPATIVPKFTAAKDLKEAVK